ncbi:hypothetical protein A3B84_01355 [Candidatus Nomurabacteria bacterium RIFCSPHIGHO2_02_FULL_35_13]|uniref:DUF5672 domain-containing protein n=1 Tax=Candidatus Nomurabacteria bacterium RIFCSPHIGHO2_02_FULL_35_13 TaxID=1801748 RepID=A0A1F6VPE9_9BACT|nr:MAG: hypothetical protein UT00_C0018G0008 [Parcubacteria group bacterium GW2011_GWA1_38_7]OGI71508.1 MAG: hypothetical protein A3B84_01355 [Candidatus Nomurabacteria bacterium RIFCSPHIGHO2_02_FULL_35_13]
MNLLKKIIKKIKFIVESYFLFFFYIFDYYKSKKIYNEPSVCGFYQCYKQPKSVIATLASFRKIYNTSSVYLFCDEGDDMSHIASHFNCKYEYISKGHNLGFYFISKEELLSWLKRFLFAAQDSKEDFVMVIENDTRIYKKVKKLKFDFNGIKSNHHLGKETTLFLKTRNNSIPRYINNIYYGGCGGALINRNFIVNNFSNLKNLDFAIDELLPYIKRQFGEKFPIDVCLAALVIYFGGTIGQYLGYAETGPFRFTEILMLKYKFRPLLGRIEVLHNDKSLYNVPLSEEENRIFLGK